MENHILKPIFNRENIFVNAKRQEEFISPNNLKNDEAHVHDYCEVYFNLSGDVSFAVENTVYPVESGNLIITRENEIHYCIHNSSGKHKYYCMWIKSEESSKNLLSAFINRPLGCDNRLFLTKEAVEEATICFDKLIKELDSGNEKSIVAVSSIMQLLEIINNLKTQASPSSEIPEMLVKLLKYIDENYYDDCSIKKLSKVFFLSRSTIIRLFNDWLNTTPYKYVESKRLAHAIEMLRENASVQETSEKCGFSDCSHFILQFKRKFGITPLKFKSYKSKQFE